MIAQFIFVYLDIEQALLENEESGGEGDEDGNYSDGEGIDFRNLVHIRWEHITAYFLREQSG